VEGREADIYGAGRHILRSISDPVYPYGTAKIRFSVLSLLIITIKPNKLTFCVLCPVMLRWKMAISTNYQRSWCRDIGRSSAPAEKIHPTWRRHWNRGCSEWTCTAVARLAKYRSSNHCAV